MLREKSDKGYKDLVPIPLICQCTSIKHMKVGMPVCHDGFPDHRTTSTIVVFLTVFEGSSSLQRTTRLESLSRPKSRLITEENSPPVITLTKKIVLLDGSFCGSQSKNACHLH
ncbi:hypothetical protein TNCV_2160591 [Trichonephila clavipes]|nr:hypothetical protein TNCV_2160591 [Trichonephila clavipes]